MLSLGCEAFGAISLGLLTVPEQWTMAYYTCTVVHIVQKYSHARLPRQPRTPASASATEHGTSSMTQRKTTTENNSTFCGHKLKRHLLKQFIDVAVLASRTCPPKFGVCLRVLAVGK